jgi:hypothetical protein
MCCYGEQNGVIITHHLLMYARACPLVLVSQERSGVCRYQVDLQLRLIVIRFMFEESRLESHTKLKSVYTKLLSYTLLLFFVV